MNKSFYSGLKFWPLIILAFVQLTILSTNTLAEQGFFTNKPKQSILSQQVQFLPVDQAFKVSAVRQKQGSILISWVIAKEYYLYRHRFQFELFDTNSAQPQPIIPEGIAKEDEYFGQVEVYYGHVSIDIPVTTSIDHNEKFTLRVGYQGCADAGLCYPPQNRYIQVDGSNTLVLNNLPESKTNTQVITEEQTFTKLLSGGSMFRIIALFFIAGLALTFTPCVLPMVPIISSVVMGQGQQPSRGRAFALSFTYVLAMATTYAAAGTLTGYFGAELNLQMKLQAPGVLIFIASLFVLFALAMFGLYELRLPHSIQTRIHKLSNKRQGGTYIGVALIGVLSSLIVSPCVSAPLAGALVYISSTADPVLGGTALLSLGLGMGVPLLLIGTFGAQALPKTGLWMNHVKVFFGVMLLGVALWMIERILPAWITLFLTIALLLGYAVYLIRPLKIKSFSVTNPALFIGLALIGFSTLLIIGGLNGQYNPLTPIANLDAEKQQASHALLQQFNSVRNLSDFDKQLKKSSGKPVMLDIYADWCISCKILENEVFTDPDVSRTLASFTLLRVDITGNSPDHQALLKRFGLFGPPGLLFFNTDARELRNYRIQGEISAPHLSKHLSALLGNL